MNVLFEIYKDKCLVNAETFKKEMRTKYKLNDKQQSELYTKIVNYQVKKYGQTLDGQFVLPKDINKIENTRKSRRAYYKSKMKG